MATGWVNERTTTTFWAALGVGFAMAVLGGAASAMSWVAPAISLLVISGGISIVLGAFGATATINYQGVTIAGVAALCVLLFFILIKEIRNPSARIDISGFPKDSSVDLYAGGNHFLGALRGGDHHVYEFAIFSDDLKTEILGLSITPPRGADGAPPSDIIFGCIDRADISRALGSQMAMQWVVDIEHGQLMTLEKRSRQVSQLGGCSRDPSPAAAAARKSFAGLRRFLPIRYAYAEDQDITSSLGDLTAESSAIRTDARRAIGETGIPAIRPLMNEWKRHSGVYRVRLGSVVSLVEMMRAMKSRRKEIGAVLSDDDLRLIATAAVDDDRTVRVYASEFLYDLADPRFIPIALDLLPSANDDGRYNLALVLRSVADEISPSERADLRKRVTSIPGSSAFGDRTRSLLGKI